MTLRTFLAASVASLALAAPALATEIPSADCSKDARIRCVPYDPGNVVQVYAAPGASFRIQLGAGEAVATITVSDQATLGDESDMGDAQDASLARQTAATGGDASRAHCDRNLCRSVVGNFIYLMPRRELAPQPLFVQTNYCPPDGGKCQEVPYAFELRTRPGDLTEATPNTIFGLRFTYAARDAAEAAAKAAHTRTVRLAEWKRRQEEAPPPPPQPQPEAQWRYAWRGAAALQPDEVWDDGRTTFLRFNGLRRVPNVYGVLPGKPCAGPAKDTETNAVGYAVEPEAGGSVIRIGKTAGAFRLRDGDLVGCVFNFGPDPDGAASATVAPPPAQPITLRPQPRHWQRRAGR